MQLVKVVYENGVFRPLDPVALPEHTELTVDLESGLFSSDSEKSTDRRVLKILSRSYETGDPHLAERHDEHQP